MSFIMVKHIRKTFKVPIKTEGIIGSLKSFFNRKYRYIKAIDDISFSIKKGEIVGYIGPNGAGKSTTIKILSGILNPDSGSVKINNLIPNVDRKKYVKNIGAVFGQKSQLWWDIPAIDSFNLLKDIYKIDDNEYKKTLNELIDLLNLKDILNIPVRLLSLGNRMKCEIAASLIHKPQVLFLDEPTIGLDAVSKKMVRDFIKKINRQNNVTVILTTHDMKDIESLCKRIILIGKGNIKRNYIVKEKKFDNKIEFTIDIRQIEINEFIKLLSSKISIIDIDIESSNIDDLIIKLYEEFEI